MVDKIGSISLAILWETADESPKISSIYCAPFRKYKTSYDFNLFDCFSTLTVFILNLFGLKLTIILLIQFTISSKPAMQQPVSFVATVLYSIISNNQNDSVIVAFSYLHIHQYI